MLSRQWRQVAVWSSSLALVYVIWWAWPAEARLQMAAVRPVDFSAGAASLALHGNVMGAWGELEEGIQYCRAHASHSPGEAWYAELLLRRDRVLLFVRRGRFAAVQQDWEILRQAVTEDDPAVQEAQRFLEQQERAAH